MQLKKGKNLEAAPIFKVTALIDGIPIEVTYGDYGYTLPKIGIEGENNWKTGLDFYPNRRIEKYFLGFFTQTNKDLFVERRTSGCYATLDADKPKENWELLISNVQLKVLEKECSRIEDIKKELKQLDYL